MLKEIHSVTQGERHASRRWFTDADLDLIVWYSPEKRITGFQLCYDRMRDEHSLTWTEDGGYEHHRVDSGESTPEANRSPVLTDSKAKLDLGRVIDLFKTHSERMDAIVARFVLKKLRELGK